MNALPTLLWLEWRKHWNLVLGLGVLLALGAYMLFTSLPSIESTLMVAAPLLVAAAVLILVLGTRPIREDLALLLSPPAGWLHQLGRFVFLALLGSLLIFPATLTLLGLVAAPLRVPDLGRWDWGLLAAAYLWLGVWWPVVAGILLLRSLDLAYQLSRTSWLVVLVGSLGLLNLAGTLVKLGAQHVWYRWFPQIPLPGDLERGYGEGALLGLPAEPLLIGPLIATLLIWLAGRIWDEVEA
jgi:hypothetical protein